MTTVTKTTQTTWTSQGQSQFTGDVTSKCKANFEVGVFYAYKNAEANTNTQSFALRKMRILRISTTHDHNAVCCFLTAQSPPIANTAYCSGLFAGGTSTNPRPASRNNYNPTAFGCPSDFVSIVDANWEARHQGATVFLYTDCNTKEPLDYSLIPVLKGFLQVRREFHTSSCVFNACVLSSDVYRIIFY